MICVDFGSGHNPRKGFLSCDITGNCDLYYNEELNIIEGLNDKVDLFYLRNVIHHLPSIEKVIECLKKYLTSKGKVVIIEPNKENYESNLFLDKLWYRFIIPRPEIKIFDYRDYESKFQNDFIVKRKIKLDVKDVLILKLKGGEIKWKKSSKN